jgi:hypothetical protein
VSNNFWNVVKSNGGERGNWIMFGPIRRFIDCCCAGNLMLWLCWCYTWSRFLHLTINGFPAYADRTWQLNKFHSTISVPSSDTPRHSWQRVVSFQHANARKLKCTTNKKTHIPILFLNFIFIFEHFSFKIIFSPFFKSSWHSGELEKKRFEFVMPIRKIYRIRWLRLPTKRYILYIYLFMAEKSHEFSYWLFYSFRKRRNFNLKDSPTLELLIKNKEKNLL